MPKMFHTISGMERAAETEKEIYVSWNLSDLGYQTSVTSSSPFLQSYMINVWMYEVF